MYLRWHLPWHQIRWENLLLRHLLVLGLIGCVGVKHIPSNLVKGVWMGVFCSMLVGQEERLGSHAILNKRTGNKSCFSTGTGGHMKSKRDTAVAVLLPRTFVWRCL